MSRESATASRIEPDDAGFAPQLDGESKRDRIVRLAGELFLDRGYDSVSINDIIDVAGGSKGTIYSNFGSKEKLFEAVVEKMCNDVTIKIDIRSTGTLDEQLTRIGKSFVSMVLTPPILRFHRLMTSIGRTFPEAGRLFYDTGPRTAQGIIATWVRSHQDRGTIRRDVDPFRLAILFHDMLIGDSMLMWLTSAVSESERLQRVDDTVALAVTVFLQGARATA